MHAFPLIEALWASLDKERPSGDDPARVVSALSRFYKSLQNDYTQGRRKRWRTPAFQAQDPGIRTALERAVELTAQLAAGFRPDSPLLGELRQLDPQMRKAFFALEQEEKTFGIPINPSPKLTEFDYLFEGWARSLLSVEPLEEFLRDFLKSAMAARGEITQAVKTMKRPDKPVEEETSAIEQSTAHTEQMESKLRALLESLPRGHAVCRPLRDAIMQHGKELTRSYQRLEQVSAPTEPCPFCGGSLSISGRCRSCGRRLPHLEEVEMEFDGHIPIESPFLSNNLRKVDLALTRFNDDPDNDALWREFQEAVRAFGKQVDGGKQHVEMLSNSPDRPIDPASAERMAEAELAEISAVFVKAQRQLSTFAFQPFPPNTDLPDDWREPLLAIEPRLQALQNKYAPPPAEDEEAPQNGRPA